MTLHGLNFVAGDLSGNGRELFKATNPKNSKELLPDFCEADQSEVDQALVEAERAFQGLRKVSSQNRVDFLRELADELAGNEKELVKRSMAETGLPEARLSGELARTTNQIRLFSDLIEEGSWIEARIDTAKPDRSPIPKPDIRQMLIPIGPVVVFGASNFPLAFSVAGGDTISALAAGNPVVVKAHPAHPGTSEIVAETITKVVRHCSLPAGTFSMLHGKSNKTGASLVEHPNTRAIGFTGSHSGGRALFDLASKRIEPIPVYAEMGSINPVFLLPGALEERAEELADGLHSSVTLGVGQFCTNPGVVAAVQGPGLDRLISALVQKTKEWVPATMLHDGIRRAYEKGVAQIAAREGVRVLARSKAVPKTKRTEASAVVFGATAQAFLADPDLSVEVFGPATILVSCSSTDELEEVARNLEGHLTATVHASEMETRGRPALIEILETRVGRIVLNGFPTGVEVCHSIHHGGPYPATTDVRSTSVGTAAIKRFARPSCYQGFPDGLLPTELRNNNERRIWRLIDGRWTRGDI